MTDPNRDDPFVAVNIEDTVRHDFAFFLIEEIVRIGFSGMTFRLVFTPAIALVAELFFLLRVDGEGGFPSPFAGFHPRMHMLALRVPCFPMALQAVSQLPQESADRGCPHGKALVSQFRRQESRTLAGPA
jgi:hypothetical protein